MDLGGNSSTHEALSNSRITCTFGGLGFFYQIWKVLPTVDSRRSARVWRNLHNELLKLFLGDFVLFKTRQMPEAFFEA